MKGTYKGIIKNLVSSKLEKIVKERTGEYCFIDSESVLLTPGTKDFEQVSFRCTFEFRGSRLVPREYTAAGYISEYGAVYLCSVAYERQFCKRLEDGSFTDPKKKYYFVFGDDLKEFKFDK